MITPADMPQSVPPQKQVRAMTSTDSFGGRVYTHPITGEEFRSVTTILSAAAKPALDKWKTKTISRFAAEHREQLATMDEDAAYDLVRSSQYTSSGVAAATGEQVHARLETLFQVLKDAQGDNVLADFGADAFVREWVEDHPVVPELVHVDRCFVELLDEFEVRPLFMENTLVNRSVGYAGSADLIAEIRPRGVDAPWRRAVIDAKSGKSIYGSVALQLVAYAKAEAILLPDGTEQPMPAIHETYALHCRPRSWSLRPMRYDRHVWEAFQALKVVDEWVNRDERRAVGDPINSGAISRMRSYNKGYKDAAA